MNYTRSEAHDSLKIKSPQHGVPLFGCGKPRHSQESQYISTHKLTTNRYSVHLQCLLTKDVVSGKKYLNNYRDCLCCIADGDPVLPQTSQTSKNMPLITLIPNYLCLQCDTTITERKRKRHSEETSHRCFVESRTGAVFCQMCNDFIWDPTLEEMRILKFGTGTFMGIRKRKYDDMFLELPREDANLILTNTIEASCRVSGIRGIYNMGSTCYINVILQCIVNNPLLRNWYLGCNHQSSECPVKACMSCSIDTMFQEFYSQDSTSGFCAAPVLACFWLSKKKAYEELASNNEQDAHEFLTFLAEELHEINSGSRETNQDLSTSKKLKTTANDGSCKCIIHQTFYGKSQSIITCQKCHRSKISVQAFMDVSLAIDDIPSDRVISRTSTLKSRLEEEFKKPEVCEYHCECGSNKARKVTCITSLPNVLCIQFKRFKQTSAGALKLSTIVSFPLKLEMLPFTNRSRGNIENPSLARECTYELQSVVEHVGELKKGHYVSYSRVGNQWFKFNDHKVTLASKSEILNVEAYMLFYVIQSLA